MDENWQFNEQTHSVESLRERTYRRWGYFTGPFTAHYQ